ncbi:DUF3857 domain-containing protein [Gramella jeungdoensis]|uniref:DUF3857 domain-containing protein n=1 Tax=Gramella jeungdoensis TaxID=708091 RepID=A0ABT0YZV8_9FLAO|nr:DUF3857 domain-containing protein [Gramella jeungdoensis]MCM8568999.1 DUF3857 domain-containing protein [Gramella jeungdoensis]
MIKFYIYLFLIFAGTSVHSQNYKFGKVSREELKSKEHSTDKDADAAILFKKQAIYYDFNQNTGFEMVTDVHERIKIYNKEGFDWATKEISIFTGQSDEHVQKIKAVTYNLVNGKIEEVKLDKDDIHEEQKNKFRKITRFTMPAITEGSVIEIEYRIVSPYITQIDPTPLQYTIPIDKLELDVTIPEFFVFSVYNNMKAPFYVNIERSKKGFQRTISKTVRTGWEVVKHERRTGTLDFIQNVYSVNKENIPALKTEPHVDHLQNYAAYLNWELQYTKFPNNPIENYSQTWEGVAKSIYNDVGLKTALDRTGFFEEDVDALITGISDPIQKTVKIFQLVKDKVKWNGYAGFVPDEGTRNTYKDGMGNAADINLLLAAMLRYAKVNANPVLLSTPDNGIPLFPTRNGFNYLITAVELPEGIILLDATDPTAGMNQLPKRARNWQGRIIRNEGSSDWVNVFPFNISETSSRMNVQISPEGINGLAYEDFNGLYAKKYREENSSKTKEDIQESLSGRHSNVDITDFNLKNFESVGSDINQNYKFKISNGVEVIGDKIYLKPLFFETLNENPFKADERIYPVFFDFPFRKKHLINIMVPEGYKVVSVPESIIVKLGEDGGEFKYSILLNGGFLRIDSQVEMSRAIFNNEEYEILKNFYNKIVEKQNETIVLEKTSNDGSSERTESGR